MLGKNQPLRRVADLVLDVLAPCACLDCCRIEPGSMRLGLCSHCLPRLVPAASPHRPTCDLCGRSLGAGAPNDDGLRRCGPCLQRESSLDRLFCLWRYQEPLDAVIHGLKFRGLTYLGRHIARELLAHLPEDLAVDRVVPVPLHWRRSWARGFNQAEEIARPLARHRGWRLEQPLVRRRATRAQTGLGREARLRNLRRGFGLKRFSASTAVTGNRLLLIDDVTTTGATLEAAAGALKAGGAAWIGAAVAGRTAGHQHYKGPSINL